MDRKAELEDQRKHELEAIDEIYELHGGAAKYELCYTSNGRLSKLSLVQLHEMKGVEFCKKLDDLLRDQNLTRVENPFSRG